MTNPVRLNKGDGIQGSTSVRKGPLARDHPGARLGTGIWGGIFMDMAAPFLYFLDKQVLPV
jgi:hypothetical protein